MTSLYFGFLVASGLAVGLAWTLVALRDRAHRPVASLLTAGLLLDVTQELVRPLYRGHPRPYDGSARAWAHVGQAAFAAYPWAVLATVLLVLGGRRRGPAMVGGMWLLYELLLVGGYRTLDLRELRLGILYLAAQLALVAAMLVVLVPWWGRWRRNEIRMTATALLVAAAVGIEAMILGLPLLSGRPWLHWAGNARPAYLFFYLIAIIVQGTELWVSRRSQRS